MDLYCWQHNTNHHLTAGELERAFYALGAAYSDELTEPDGDRVYAGELSIEHPICPVAVAREWADPEMYAEVIEQGVECRKRVAGETGR
jgi:hypothetical protein